MTAAASRSRSWALTSSTGSHDITKRRRRAEGARLLHAKRLLLPAYDQVLKCSHIFNLLDARGAISVTERVAVMARVRKLAVTVAQLWTEQQQETVA